MVRLARQLPWAHAMKILLGGEPISAEQALAMGLVSEVVPAEELQARAQQYADNICAPGAAGLAGHQAHRAGDPYLPWQDAFQYEMEQAGW